MHERGNSAAVFHQFRREVSAAQELVEATLILATEQGLVQWQAAGTFLRGWVLTMQGHKEDGLAQLRQGLTTYRATGTMLDLPWYLGVLAANASYFALSATGLGAILATSVTLFWLIKWLGAAYLLWVGARMVVGALRGRRRQTITADVSSATGANSFRRGFVTQASNPNLLVYFTAILPQFLDTQASLPGQVVILGVSSIIIELLVLSAYSTAVGLAGRMARQLRFARVVQGFGGRLLIGAGVRLAATDQS